VERGEHRGPEVRDDDVHEQHERRELEEPIDPVGQAEAHDPEELPGAQARQFRGLLVAHAAQEHREHDAEPDEGGEHARPRGARASMAMRGLPSPPYQFPSASVATAGATENRRMPMYWIISRSTSGS